MHSDTYGDAAERTTVEHIHMPAPTYWPFVFGFGLMLMFAGLATHWIVGVTGLVIAVRSGFGWWRTVIPVELHEEVPIDLTRRPAPISIEGRSVIRLKLGEADHRARIPVEVHPYTAGIWGGLIGGIVMAGLACLYGLIAEHSIWWPVNLLAGVVLPSIGNASDEQLRAFNGLAFFVALGGHVVMSALVGLVYSVMLPMFPKYAPFWAGIMMPLLWSAFIATSLSIVNPALNSRINWYAFVACQLGFGVVGGYVIARSTRIHTYQSLGFAQRAGLEVTPGGHRQEKP